MKRIMMLVILCFTVGCTSVTTESAPAEKDVLVESTAKKVLYTRANNWVKNNFSNPKSVVKYTDKGYGTVAGRYLLRTVTNEEDTGPGKDIYAAIKIKVQNNSAKITVTPEPFSVAKSNKTFNYGDKDVQRDVSALISSFQQAMKSN